VPVCKLLSGWTYSMKCVCCNAGERKKVVAMPTLSSHTSTKPSEPGFHRVLSPSNVWLI